MSFYQFRHPWAPGYATPEYVLGEPPGRGTFVTKQLPRGTIPDRAGTLPAASNGTMGYAVPAYVQAEPPGQGVFVTKQLPRRTVGSKQPDYLARPVLRPRPIKAPKKKSLGSLGGSSLGDVKRFGGGAQDPFFAFGQDAAKAILAQLEMTAPAQRAEVLKEILRRINPGLVTKVTYRIDALRQKGVPTTQAMQQALQENLSGNIKSELVTLGKKGRPRASGLVALGVVRATAAQTMPGTTTTATSRPATIKKYLSLGGPTIPVVFKSDTGSAMYGTAVWRGANWAELKRKLPKLISAKIEEWANKSARAGTMDQVIKDSVLKGDAPLIKIMGDNGIYVTLKGQPKFTYKVDNLKNVTEVDLRIKPRPEGNWLEKTVSAVINFPMNVVVGVSTFIIKIVEKAVEVAGDVLDKIGEYACKAVNHEMAEVAAVGGSAAAGDPTGQSGQAGVLIAQSLCAGGGGGYDTGLPESRSSALPWVVLGAGALVLVWGATQ